MGTARPTVERLQLGLALTRLRTAANRSQGEAAEAIGRTGGRLSQVENGKGGLGPDELSKLLDFYGVRGPERETILALGAAARRRAPRRAYVDNLPEPFQRLSELQAAAREINWYECGVIPGLVQSPDYVRAIMALSNSIYWDDSEQETSERIAYRQEHQRRVLEASDPKTISVVFTEDTLDHVIGGPSVMRGQVLHLLQLTERHPTLSIRIIPNTTVDNPALGGGLVVLDFPHATPVSFSAVLYGPYTFYDHREDIEPMQRLFRRVEELSLSREDSRALLVDRIKEGKG
ncbi:transcriptional regulator with XRE-family HTH domain [Saccharothrix tamanrassetensis]|uniref:Transcriptional regulator with XRE-family HTH domain n=1 Tax=Saccharothrix tamanrassetensis TaxID=1051531 RepID=A0A841CFB1_9PSEU|nr:helix-turn-helix transcriptional regulator [Saccharothrix tamanrassetensis]MBB5954406.1 transcriptional regulator with XRE-family HTH domain [Saccharothrix tamanrassetensis]